MPERPNTYIDSRPSLNSEDIGMQGKDIINAQKESDQRIYQKILAEETRLAAVALAGPAKQATSIQNNGYWAKSSKNTRSVPSPHAPPLEEDSIEHRVPTSSTDPWRDKRIHPVLLGVATFIAGVVLSNCDPAVDAGEDLIEYIETELLP